MKSTLLFLIVFMPIFLFSQVNESFSDGDISNNPIWLGDTDSFVVNENYELQSAAINTSVSSIFTISESFVNAQWECSVMIDYTTSSSNFASIYISSDSYNIVDGCEAYYIQIGGTNDEVSLYVQKGKNKTKIIDGIDKRLDGSPVKVDVKLTRDSFGEFELYSKLATESEFVLEGNVINNEIISSLYFGLLYSNTSTTGGAYFFDNIIVTGEKAIDTKSPEWLNVEIIDADKVSVVFSERINLDNLSVFLDDRELAIVSKELSIDKKSAIIQFGNAFEKGHLYKLELENVSDVSDNELIERVKYTGIPEDIEIGDLIWNEIMFENPEGSSEYVEIFNRSNKVIDLSGLLITTRKTDGSLNSGDKLINLDLLAPYAYAAFTSTPDLVAEYHHVPEEADIRFLDLSSLNNTSTTLVLCNVDDEHIYDEITYDTKWHHLLIKDPKGVALEKIHPDMPVQDPNSWHSASSESNYGTPGYINSQYKDIYNSTETNKTVWIEPEVFTPNNDGQDDLCFIHYDLGNNGYVGNVWIFNAVGVNVCKLINNNLLSASGYVSWDGRSDQGKIVNTGIYVIYFEVFNAETGDKKLKKIPIVVSSR